MWDGVGVAMNRRQTGFRLCLWSFGVAIEDGDALAQSDRGGWRISAWGCGAVTSFTVTVLPLTAPAPETPPSRAVSLPVVTVPKHAQQKHKTACDPKFQQNGMNEARLRRRCPKHHDRVVSLSSSHHWQSTLHVPQAPPRHVENLTVVPIAVSRLTSRLLLTTWKSYDTSHDRCSKPSVVDISRLLCRAMAP
ncbi:hypothetical protein VTK56DRAFT_5735 [Thermocarpiscus australiensis]